MKHVAILDLWILIFTSEFVVCQTTQKQSSSTDELKSIYESIEYNDHHQDLAEAWQIADRDLIRGIFSELWAHGALRKKGENGPLAEAEKDSIVKRSLYEDRLGVVCRKRYYDDEIGHLEFVGADPYELEPLDDWVYIQDVVGQTLYDTIKKKDYRFIRVNKISFGSEPGFGYDIYLHALSPEVMLFSVSTDTCNSRRWMFSIFGEMGNDLIDLPFWFKGTMAAGGRFVYVDSTQLRKDSRDYQKFGFSVGWEGPINFSVPGISTTGIFKERKLSGSSTNVFFRVTYTSGRGWPSFLIGRDAYLEMSLGGSLKIVAKGREDSVLFKKPQFHSVNNSISFTGRLKHFASVSGFGSLDLGVGLSWHDVNRYNLHIVDTTDRNRLIKDLPSRGNLLPFLEAGFGRDGGLLQYGLATQLNQNLSEGYRFIVIKGFLMLSNTLGIDIRYFKALTTSRLPSWQYDNYIVVSPILRINY